MLARAAIIGNLGRDPEMRFTPSGNPVSSMSVATSHRYTKDGETQEETTWWRVTAWGRLAETCNQFLGKGSKVYVEGRISINEWEDQEGCKRQQVQLTANQVLFLDKRSTETAQGSEDDFDPDELPF